MLNSHIKIICADEILQRIRKLTSEIITIVLMLCSEIIRQKSPIVSSNGSCVMMNDSELSYPSMNVAFMYVDGCGPKKIQIIHIY